MKDCKVITISATEHSPTIDIRDKVAKVDIKTLTGSITSPSLTTAIGEPCIDVSTTNLGDPFIQPDAYGYFFSDSASLSETITKDIQSRITETLSNIQETISKSFATSFTDSTQSVIDSIALSMARPVSDIVGVSDTVLLEVLFARSAEDSVSQSDESTRQIQPLKLESLFTLDVDLRNIGKVNSETISQTDFFAVTATKPFLESQTISDFSFRDIGKYLYEIKLADDTLISFNVATNLSDLVDATDDFLGEANIDDDQSAQVTKVLSNPVVSNDILSRIVDYERIFQDQPITTEFLSFSANRALFDFAVTNDSLAFSAAIVLNDSVTVTDLISPSLAQGRLADDSSSTTDLLTLATNKAVSDSAVMADTLSQSVQALRLDNTSILDSVSTVFDAFRDFTDSASSSDAELSKAVGSSVSDQSEVNEALSYNFGFNLIDTVSNLTDSGTIYSQDYFLEDYVEFGYVGSIYTF